MIDEVTLRSLYLERRLSLHATANELGTSAESVRRALIAHDIPRRSKNAVRTTAEDRFWAMVAVAGEDDCWLWLGCIKDNGYGRFTGAQDVYAHRYAYELVKGKVPDSLVIDHKCRNRGCVNPKHLEAVTQQENCRRGYWGQKTQCPHGHPYDEENTIKRKDGSRGCKACRKTWNNRARTKPTKGGFDEKHPAALAADVQ